MYIRLRIKARGDLCGAASQRSEAPEGPGQQDSPGPDRDLILRKVSQVETALHIDEWMTSPGLQPPK